MYAYNNTVYGNTVGLGTDVTAFISKNNIAYNNATDYSGTFNSASTNNISKDATAPAYNTYYRNATVNFVSTSNPELKTSTSPTPTPRQGDWERINGRC